MTAARSRVSARAWIRSAEWWRKPSGTSEEAAAWIGLLQFSLYSGLPEAGLGGSGDCGGGGGGGSGCEEGRSASSGC